MRKIVIILFLSIAFMGCRTKEVVTTRHHFTHVSDSVYIDCYDTIFVWQRGDTVRIKEIKREREFKYKYIMDTIRSSDTLHVKGGVASHSGGNIFGKWEVGKYLFFAGFATAIFFIFAIVIARKNFSRK